ncbi:MIP/aquaporin family protein [Ilumatobacter coccineus]|uniref:Putative aquaporin Z n=1 Tax=Ilumatobacter coccineus (strain NBRC 103263 / KCTC 29153 / YM16-304) TaxID=1313172 RepID=A0A6C7E9T2_ILUCY|nr:aquaporin [Ilumatobacter coccineus]BAN00806.1 putative aquaporin Z [Ilumatobacter coccineus YM16-304]
MADDAASFPPPTGASGTTPAPAGLSRNVVTELVGTLVLMLAGPGLIVLSNGQASDLAVALSFGAGLAVAIGVIGAVANPAFTLALLVVREISIRDAVGDWIGQIAGGILGAAVVWGINDQTRSSLGANGWDRSGFRELGSVMAAELVFTIIVVVVLLSSISQGLSKASIAAFTGLAYAIGHLVLGGIDGGGMNPARSLGSAIFSDNDPNALGQVWVFIVVPLVAAVAAVFVWLMIDDAEIDDTIFDDTFVDDLQNAATGDTD